MKRQLSALFGVVFTLVFCLTWVVDAHGPGPHSDAVSSLVLPAASPRASRASLQGADQEAQNVELMSYAGGGIKALAVGGDYAYLGEGAGLTVLDISNPASFTRSFLFCHTDCLLSG